MKLQINRKLLPVKAHFFFFFAALGPILPQLNVFGRQLGVSAEVMGYVTAGLPLLWAAAKPTFGYIVDYWPNHRKLVFMFLILLMSGSYCGLWFIPTTNVDTKLEYIQHIYQMNDTVYVQKYTKNQSDFLEKFKCHWSCSPDHNFEAYLTNTTFINSIYLNNDRNITCTDVNMDFNDDIEGVSQITCKPRDNCNLLCFEDGNLNRKKRQVDINNVDSNVESNEDIDRNIDTGISAIAQMNNSETYTYKNKTENYLNNTIISNDDNMKSIDISKEPLGLKDMRAKISKVVHSTSVKETTSSFYVTAAFWSFVVLMCVGTVAFNVANCIGDAVCFDVLGAENSSKYGSQRAWGTAGYGVTALLGGWLVDKVSAGSSVKDFTPAFVLALAATFMDLFSCRRLKLPSLSSPSDSGKALRAVLKIPRVLVFICFAVVAGVFDSFIIYYMFWFLEDLAEQTGHQEQIKLIEGIVVAGQSFIGEIVFFALSGKIISRWGYGATMTLSLFCYGVRMALISLIYNPWHLVFIESVMQGPTYALCYAAIVGYAAHVAPPGYSATVQGIVAGMDDGLGFAIGSLVGGQLYASCGGRGAFRVGAVAGGAGALLHAALHALANRTPPAPPREVPEEGEKMIPIHTLADADTHKHNNDIYRDTVVPLADKTDR